MDPAERCFRLWMDATPPGDGEGTGTYLACAPTIAEIDALGQAYADYHRATVVAYPPLHLYLVGDRFYQPTS